MIIDYNKLDNEIIEIEKQRIECWNSNGELYDQLFKRKIQLESELKEFKNNNARNILIIGEENKGKSSLANVLVTKDILNSSDRNNSFQERISSSNRHFYFKCEDFEENWKSYRIIDTAGVNPSDIPKKLSSDSIKSNNEWYTPTELADFTKSISKGINQILLVVNPLPDKRWIEFYRLVCSLIFDDNVLKYTTIVRTNFGQCEDVESCLNERLNIKKEIKELFEKEFESATTDFDERIIFVDNPTLKNKIGNELENNKRKRDASRKILMDRLLKCNELYLPNNLYKLDEVLNNKSNSVECKEELLSIYYARTGQEEQIVEQAEKACASSENIENIRVAATSATSVVNLVTAILTITAKAAACTIM